MCLSTVYKKSGDTPVYLCKNIARVIPNGNTLELYDLLGKKTVIEGYIADIDLMENTILVQPPEA